jgi:glyoxylase-like metal-dependent hydrolase (beta-lactamase superfamily II)
MARVKIILPSSNPMLNDYGGCGNCNTSLIESSGKWIIVDPGLWPVGMRGYLHYALKKEGLEPDDIDIVINTHLHYDHSDNNIFFRGKPLYLHEIDCNNADTLMMQDLWPDGRYKPEKYTIPVKVPERTGFLIGALELNRVSGTFQLTEDVRLIETPGHTPGSMSVIVDTSLGTVAIIGDLAIRRQDYIEKRTPIFVRDRQAIMESHEKITKLNPVAVIPGHDLPIWDLGRFPVPMKNFELTEWFPE